jgi:hypothetical protein
MTATVEGQGVGAASPSSVVLIHRHIPIAESQVPSPESTSPELSQAARATTEVPKFDVVDALTPVGTAPCAECRGPIVDAYYEADEGVICANCQARITAAHSSDNSGSFGRALLFGVASAAVAAAIYFAALTATGREITAIVLLVGFIVGKAVRVGSRSRGGRRFQWLALSLTYLAIAATYVPFVMKGFSPASRTSSIELLPASTNGGAFLVVNPVTTAPAPPPASLGRAAIDYSALLLLAAAAPILEGMRHVLTLLLIAAALFQAWRMNRRTPVMISGPYRVRT